MRIAHNCLTLPRTCIHVLLAVYVLPFCSRMKNQTTKELGVILIDMIQNRPDAYFLDMHDEEYNVAAIAAKVMESMQEYAAGGIADEASIFDTLNSWLKTE